MRVIVHYLRAGQTPCSMPGRPCDWPEGHVWAGRWEQVTCSRCQETRVEARKSARGDARPTEAGREA